ncbi:MAG: hypothetical protein HN816_02765, partial [Gammaproteobacteria bacterium]|nr:hypothetical protein [Gammaproteobacteria bacterium]
VSAVMYQPPETVVMRMSKRDDYIDRDTYAVTLDSTGHGEFAYWFIIALGDTVMDGKVLPERRYTTDWDGPWLYKTARFDEGWSAETFYPWSMMSLPEKDGARDIGFAVARQVSHTNERYYWPGHSYSSPQFVTALNTMRVEGVEPRQQYSLIPYLSSVLDEARDDTETRGGIDLTWKPSTMAELTLSVNPDFGAVEADSVVLNLTAFETFFPEKRLFFQEGNELFETTPRANNGRAMRELTNENFATTSRRVYVTEFLPAPISLINTRRIGGTASQVTLPAGITPKKGERDLPTELLGAVKLTGRIGNFRYGVVGAFEDDVEWQGSDTLGNPVGIDDEGRDFAAIRVSYEKSAVNRYALGYMGTLVDGPIYDAAVHGLDWHYGTGDGRWALDLQLMHSDVDDVSGQGGVFDLTYSGNSRIQHVFKLDYFDEDVDINDLGFLRRNDYAGMLYAYRYAQRSKNKGLIRANRGAVTLVQQYNISRGQVVDSGIYWRNTLEVPGRNTIRTSLAWLPERYEDVDSRGHGAYLAEDRIWWNLLWTTDASARFSWSFGVGGIQEDLGEWTGQYSVGLTMRPNDLLVVSADLKYKRRDGWLVYQGGPYFGAYNGIDWQPSIDASWFIRPGHQLRFSFQWVGVRVDEQGFFSVPGGDGELMPATRTSTDHDFTVSMMTAQLRYRWEIAPLTDLFLVYNRGNRLPFRNEDEFSSLFEDTFDDPLVDSFVIKLRYRFGN